MVANNKGFTIIEVVITIAIGAAVMALVLNAVAGARRSQRNNARQADVNKIAAGVNEYIAVRNALPDHWDKIKDIVDASDFGHYEASSINAGGSWSTTIPAPSGTNGVFRALDSVGQSILDTQCPEHSDGGACNAAPVISGNTYTLSSTPGCTAGDGDTDQCTYIFATGSIDATPQATGLMGDGTSDDADYVVIFRQASCLGNNQVAAGGIREMAIAYKLEGQSDIICLEV